MSAQHYLDFDIEIGMGDGGGQSYPVAVLASPGGQARGALHWALDEGELNNYLISLENALLRSGAVQRRVLSPQEDAVQEFGLRLFNMLLTGDVRSRYDSSQLIASQQSKGLRVRLRILPPELASLPWEFLYDDRHGEYLCLSNDTPIVRYLELAQPVAPLTTSAPLRVLGMVASPNNLELLNVKREKQIIAAALQTLQSSGLVQLQWVEGATADALNDALDEGSWHVFHFIGHGGFDANRDEGFVALCDADGDARRLGATALARLLGDHRSLRLVLLNACEGARASKRDIFSSTTTTLLRRNRYLAAVLAMQHSISDRAAATFASVFYRSIASGRPVDDAVTRARKAMSRDKDDSVEWGTPVLYLRAADGVLFDVSAQTEAVKEQLRQAAREREAREARERVERIERAAREQAERERVERIERAAREQAKRELEEDSRVLFELLAQTEAPKRQRIERAEREQAERERVERERDKLSELTARLAKLNVNGDDEQIIEIGEQIVQLDSKHAVRSTLAKAYRDRGVSYAWKRDYDRAIADYTRAIELSPQTADYYRARAVSYHEKGDYDRALADHTRAIELSPQTALYYQQRGVSYHMKGDYDRALADYTRAIELSPQTAAYYRERGVSYAWKRDYDRALADYTRAIELSPQTADYYRARGGSYAWKRDYDRAIADYTRAIELSPQTANYYRVRGGIYHMKGDYDRALADYTRAIELDPTNGEYYYSRGFTYKNQSNTPAARQDFQRALELGHSDAQTELDKL